MSWGEKRRARKAERAAEAKAQKIRHVEDELADIEYHTRTFGFGMAPSTRRRADERIDELRAKLSALREGDDD